MAELVWLGETSPVDPYGKDLVTGLNNCLAAMESYVEATAEYLRENEENCNLELKRSIGNLEYALLNSREIRKLLLKMRSECAQGKVFRSTMKAVIDVPIEIRGSDLEALL